MPNRSFYRKLASISEELGMNPRDLLAVMFFESGVNPAAKNPHGGATGLIQFMPATLRGLGVEDVSGFSNKSAEQQLDYVKRYIEGKRSIMGGKPFKSATQYYHANFFPATLTRWVGSDPIKNRNVVVVDGSSTAQNERAAYRENKVLDTDHDGKITVGDLTRTIMGVQQSPKFKEMLAGLNDVAGPGVVSEVAMAKRRRIPTNESNAPSVNSFVAKLDTLLDSFMRAAKHTDTCLISLSSDTDLPSKLEYARILKIALKNEFNINSDVYANDSDVQVSCKSDADIQLLCNELSIAFKDATAKLGGINIKASIHDNAIPSYQALDLQTAVSNYKAFRTNFNKGQ